MDIKSNVVDQYGHHAAKISTVPSLFIIDKQSDQIWNKTRDSENLGIQLVFVSHLSPVCRFDFGLF